MTRKCLEPLPYLASSGEDKNHKNKKTFPILSNLKESLPPTLMQPREKGQKEIFLGSRNKYLLAYEMAASNGISLIVYRNVEDFTGLRKVEKNTPGITSLEITDYKRFLVNKRDSRYILISDWDDLSQYVLKERPNGYLLRTNENVGFDPLLLSYLKKEPLPIFIKNNFMTEDGKYTTIGNYIFYYLEDSFIATAVIAKTIHEMTWEGRTKQNLSRIGVAILLSRLLPSSDFPNSLHFYYYAFWSLVKELTSAKNNQKATKGAVWDPLPNYMEKFLVISSPEVDKKFENIREVFSSYASVEIEDITARMSSSEDDIKAEVRDLAKYFIPFCEKANLIDGQYISNDRVVNLQIKQPIRDKTIYFTPTRRVDYLTFPDSEEYQE